MRTKQERDIALYGTFVLLMKKNMRENTGNNGAPRDIMGQTYDELGMIYDISSSSARHIVYRMQNECRGKRDMAQRAANNDLKTKCAIMSQIIDETK